MALLSLEDRKKYFAELNLGEYNEANIKKLQKKYLLRKADWDGVYGANTDNLLRHLKAVKDNCKNFAPEEFRCGCGGKYCCGYPTYMKPVELKAIQNIRSHYGKPMTVTCGVRCSRYNKAVGGITNSEHLKGLAVDYHIKGVTDTLANRKSSIKWIYQQPNHHYTYGDGIFAETNNGKTKTGYVSSPGMGNCMHTDCKETSQTVSAVTSDGTLVVDGVGGAATVKAMQRYFGTTQDGVLSGQNKSLNKYYPALVAVEYGKNGSACVKNLQRWLGVTQDGVLGQNTVKAWQKKLGISSDGIFGTNSMKAWQKFLNDNKDKKAEYPVQTIIDKELDACKVQADWMKNSKYEYEKNPTVEKSKKKGTCVTYVSCVLQRIGILPSGQSLWHDEDGKVYGNNSKMTVTYPKKTLHQLKSQLKAGDIIMDGSGVGSGSHIFILTGKWSGDNPIIWDNHSGQDGKGAYTYTRNRNVIAIVRLK